MARLCSCSPKRYLILAHGPLMDAITQPMDESSYSAKQQSRNDSSGVAGSFPPCWVVGLICPHAVAVNKKWLFRVRLSRGPAVHGLDSPPTVPLVVAAFAHADTHPFNCTECP